MVDDSFSPWDIRVQEAWNENAEEWKENSETRWQTGSRKEIIPFLQKHLNSGHQILDVGCGSGYSTHLLDMTGYEAQGADISPEMIKHAKNTYPELSFTVADVSNMNMLKQESMDAVLAINVMEWTETPVDALKELYRVMKPSGYLCIGILGPTAGPRAYSYRRVYGEDVFQNTMMPWEFLRMAKENSWELVDHLYVWRKGVQEKHIGALPFAMQQALTFMTVFMLRKKDESK